MEVREFRADLYAPVAKDSDFGFKILPPDFTFTPLRAGDALADIYRSIAAGIGGTAMPTWKNVLPESDLWALAHYVRSLVALRGTRAADELRRQLLDQPAWTPPPLDGGAMRATAAPAAVTAARRCRRDAAVERPPHDQTHRRRHRERHQQEQPDQLQRRRQRALLRRGSWGTAPRPRAPSGDQRQPQPATPASPARRRRRSSRPHRTRIDRVEHQHHREHRRHHQRHRRHEAAASPTRAQAHEERTAARRLRHRQPGQRRDAQRRARRRSRTRLISSAVKRHQHQEDHQVRTRSAHPLGLAHRRSPHRQQVDEGEDRHPGEVDEVPEQRRHLDVDARAAARAARAAARPSTISTPASTCRP